MIRCQSELFQSSVKLVDGFLIQPEKPKDPEQEKQDNVNLGPFAGFVAPKNPIDLIVTQPTKEAEEMSYVFGMMRPNYVAVMPTAAGLEYTTDKGFDVVPLFMSDSTCWNELENTEIRKLYLIRMRVKCKNLTR
mgnify:CR=1 FL=1